MINKKFLQGFAIGIMSVAALEVFNKAVNEKAKKYKLNVNDGYFYTWKEGSLHYTVKGEGKPVLLIHDLNVLSSGYEWNKIENELAKNHKVYTLDLLGCGLSDKPSITYTNYTFVLMIKDFCNDIIKEKCDVISSNDSTAIVVMADNMEDIFNKKILINPAEFDLFAMQTTRLNLIEKNVLYLPIIGTTVYNIYTAERNVKSIVDSYINNKAELENLTEAYYEASHTNNSRGRYLYACKKCSYLGVDIRDAISEAKDVYIVKGDDTDKSIINEYHDINPNIKVNVIGGSKLLPHIENVNETLDAINNIL